MGRHSPPSTVEKLHNIGMNFTPETQSSFGNMSQGAANPVEQNTGSESLDIAPITVPPVVALSEDHAAALDELCRTVDASDTHLSRSISYRISLEKCLPWDTDPRLIADALARAGHPPEVVRTLTWDWALWTCESEIIWPWVAQNLARAGELLEDSTSATRVLWALTHFPVVPKVLVPALAQVAIGRSERNRALAQELLAGFPEAGDLALEAVRSPIAHVRRVGAAWLSSLTIPDGVARLRAARAQEKDRLARADLLRTLQIYGDDVTDLVTAEALTLPKRQPKRPPVALAWFPFDALPEVHLSDGARLDPDIVCHWVREAHRLKTPDGSGTIELYLRLLDEADARELSAVVVESWVAHNRGAVKGESLTTKGLLAFAIGMEGERLAAAARSALSHHPTWRAESETVLTAVAANSSTEALQVIVSVDAQHRLPQVRGFAHLLTRAIAAERGWSEAELGDRSIPTVGFRGDGLLHLSYGEREFLGRLTPDLTISVTDADGRVRKSLPAARKGEDSEAVARTRRRLSSARKEAAAVLKVQGRRLYEAMCTGRAWPAPLWRELLADHPLARQLVTRLVWMAHRQDEEAGESEPGTDAQAPDAWTFRPAEDGQLRTVSCSEPMMPPWCCPQILWSAWRTGRVWRRRTWPLGGRTWMTTRSSRSSTSSQLGSPRWSRGSGASQMEQVDVSWPVTCASGPRLEAMSVTPTFTGTASSSRTSRWPSCAASLISTGWMCGARTRSPPLGL